MSPAVQAALQAPMQGPAAERAQRAAHCLGLVAAAARAKLLADAEEAEMLRQVRTCTRLHALARAASPRPTSCAAPWHARRVNGSAPLRSCKMLRVAGLRWR